MYKKSFLTIVVLMAIFILPVQARSINVEIDGNPVVFTGQQPVLVDGKTFVPVRGVFEQLGCYVTWDVSIQSVVIVKDGEFQITLQIGNPTFDISSQVGDIRTMPLEVPAQLINGSTMLPLRDIIEAIGVSIDWDGNTRTVLISTPYYWDEWMPIDVMFTFHISDDSILTIICHETGITNTYRRLTEFDDYIRTMQLWEFVSWESVSNPSVYENDPIGLVGLWEFVSNHTPHSPSHEGDFERLVIFDKEQDIGFFEDDGNLVVRRSLGEDYYVFGSWGANRDGLLIIYIY